MEKCVVKVLKGTAEYLDMPFSDLLESMAVTALDGHCFFGADALKQIAQLSKIYGLEDYLDALASAARDEDEDDEEEQEPHQES